MNSLNQGKDKPAVKGGDAAIREAADLINAGGLVAFPTETVYGLGANALDGQAVARIFEAKQRPDFNPLIVHCADTEQAAELTEFTPYAQLLAEHLWPGPITFILKRKADCPVSELCSAGLPTLAVRVPQHKLARELLQRAGVPIAAPSANRSGRLSPTAPVHVLESLGNAVDMILAGGACEVGLESTVVDLTGEQPVLLRSGAIIAEQLEQILESEVLVETESTNDSAPKSPGQTLNHYAPSIPVRMNAVDLEPGEALLAFGSDKFMGIKGGGAAKDLPDSSRRNLSKESDLNEAAANLFRMLHELDCPEHKGIAVMPMPKMGIGIAINDRLKRASQSV